MELIRKTAWLPIRNRKVLFVRGQKHVKDGEPFFINAGGKIEPGESKEDALCREVREELSVGLIRATIELGRPEPFKDMTPKGKPMVSYPYFAHCLGILKPAGEINEMAWFSSADALRTTSMGRQILAWLKETGRID
jgi:8-oxo-dGTP diphosphatase